MARTNRTRRPLLRGRRVGTCYPATADAPVGSRRPGHGVRELLTNARRQFRGGRAIPLGSYRGGERYADPDEINDDQQGEEQAHSVFSLGWSALTPWNNNCSLYLPSRLLTKKIKRKWRRRWRFEIQDELLARMNVRRPVSQFGPRTVGVLVARSSDIGHLRLVKKTPGAFAPG
jgi:hypothetical protein